MTLSKRILIFSCTAIIAAFTLFGNLPLEQYEHILQQVPNWDKDAAIIREISGGATNQNYQIKIGNEKYFLRCAGNTQILGNSLEREFICTTYGSGQRLAPRVIVYSPEEGVMVTEFIDAKPERLNVHQQENMSRIARNLKALHSSKIQAPFDANPFEIVRDYLENLDAFDIDVLKYLDPKVLEKIAMIEEALSQHPQLCLCHMDLHTGNFIDDGKAIWLIDWEYAGMGNPYFDLAVFSSGDQFTDEEMEQLLGFYSEGEFITEKEMAKLYLFRIIADFRWGLWSLIQSEVSDLDKDYIRWAHESMQAVTLRAENPKFDHYLQLLR